jgi:general secretion pathway protein M
MKRHLPFPALRARYPAIALLTYAGTVIALALTVVVCLADLYERYATVMAAARMLAEIEGRKLPVRDKDATSGGSPVGSPFLEGQTVTVAAAALQQRVASAVSRVGGAVLSSQVDLQGPPSESGFVTLITSCEVDQPGLQKLLYDIEVGMPFLFVDQLVVQEPEGTAAIEGTRVHVLLAVSGQWEGAK